MKKTKSTRRKPKSKTIEKVLAKLEEHSSPKIIKAIAQSTDRFQTGEDK